MDSIPVRSEAVRVLDSARGRYGWDYERGPTRLLHSIEKLNSRARLSPVSNHHERTYQPCLQTKRIIPKAAVLLPRGKDAELLAICTCANHRVSRRGYKELMASTVLVGAANGNVSDRLDVRDRALHSYTAHSQSSVS